MTEIMLPEARFVHINNAEILMHVHEHAPIGHSLSYRDIRPKEFIDHDFAGGLQADLLNLIKPFVASAVDDYQEHTGREADQIRVLDIVNQDPSKKYDTQKWHRDKVFPGENLYVAAEDNALTVTVQGPDVLGYRNLPFGFPINKLTDALVSSGRLERVTGRPGQTTVMPFGVVHKSGDSGSEPRSSVAFALYNRAHARETLISRRWGGYRLRRAMRQDPFVEF